MKTISVTIGVIGIQRFPILGKTPIYRVFDHTLKFCGSQVQRPVSGRLPSHVYDCVPYISPRSVEVSIGRFSSDSTMLRISSFCLFCLTTLWPWRDLELLISKLVRELSVTLTTVTSILGCSAFRSRVRGRGQDSCTVRQTDRQSAFCKGASIRT